MGVMHSVLQINKALFSLKNPHVFLNSVLKHKPGTTEMCWGFENSITCVKHSRCQFIKFLTIPCWNANFLFKGNEFSCLLPVKAANYTPRITMETLQWSSRPHQLLLCERWESAPWKLTLWYTHLSQILHSLCLTQPAWLVSDPVCCEMVSSFFFCLARFPCGEEAITALPQALVFCSQFEISRTSVPF